MPVMSPSLPSPPVSAFLRLHPTWNACIVNLVSRCCECGCACCAGACYTPACAAPQDTPQLCPGSGHIKSMHMSINTHSALAAAVTPGPPAAPRPRPAAAPAAPRRLHSSSPPAAPGSLRRRRRRAAGPRAPAAPPSPAAWHALQGECTHTGAAVSLQTITGTRRSMAGAARMHTRCALRGREAGHSGRVRAPPHTCCFPVLLFLLDPCVRAFNLSLQAAQEGERRQGRRVSMPDTQAGGRPAADPQPHPQAQLRPGGPSTAITAHSRSSGLAEQRGAPFQTGAGRPATVCFSVPCPLRGGGAEQASEGLEASRAAAQRAPRPADQVSSSSSSSAAGAAHSRACTMPTAAPPARPSAQKRRRPRSTAVSAWVP